MERTSLNREMARPADDSGGLGLQLEDPLWDGTHSHWILGYSPGQRLWRLPRYGHVVGELEVERGNPASGRGYFGV